MQLKNLIVASLATVGSAAVIQDRQIPDNLIPTEVQGIFTELPTEVRGIFSQVTNFVPLITAIPPSLASEIESVIETLPTSAYPSFISSIISQLPPDLQSSFSDFQASITSQIGDLATLTDIPTTAAPTGTESVPTNTDTTGSGTTSAPTTTDIPNSGSKTFVGLGVMGVAGVLGLALAL
ncbi:uncharacterized protein DFL_006157 [Arthrobotrys flagrans]|uniref:Uncharacterized protein n=1 Tax=Arthrobotrys flagrans TaxID=97331 RepID=A0A436ZZG3_ARTFL|nr:hypothetical protein DFL_006157 [Arthrobotrys flagrans]